MFALIKGRRSCCYLDVVLEPGERMLVAPAALSSMDADVRRTYCLRGGLWRALIGKLFSGETWCLQWLANAQPHPCGLSLSHATPGEILCAQLRDKGLSLQSGAFIAATSGVNLKLEYAGVTSWLAREGLFRTRVSGQGRVWFGGAGALVERNLDGELIIDQQRLVSYEASLQVHFNCQGKLFARLLGAEGSLTRIRGEGKIVLQAHSLGQLAKLMELR